MRDGSDGFLVLVQQSRLFYFLFQIIDFLLTPRLFVSGRIPRNWPFMHEAFLPFRQMVTASGGQGGKKIK